jgi:hypothetical protein
MAPSARPSRVTPRAQDLPGIVGAIPALERVAAAYADVRDRRLALAVDEARLKQQAITLLKQHNKTVYRRNGIELTLIPGEDTIRLRVTVPDEAPPDPDDLDDEAAS